MTITFIPRYAFTTSTNEENEVEIAFASFPEIISHMPRQDFEKMDREHRISFAHDAVITAICARVMCNEKIPDGDDERVICDGFVELEVEEAMKVALHEVFRTQFKSISALARKLDRPETAIRRLLNFRHRSRPSEIKWALNSLGKRLDHVWHLSAAA